MLFKNTVPLLCKSGQRQILYQSCFAPRRGDRNEGSLLEENEGELDRLVEVKMFIIVVQKFSCVVLI